eukprot:5774721-Lingulodinium_polyedra.AAC.1
MLELATRESSGSRRARLREARGCTEGVARPGVLHVAGLDDPVEKEEALGEHGESPLAQPAQVEEEAHTGHLGYTPRAPYIQHACTY